MMTNSPLLPYLIRVGSLCEKNVQTYSIQGSGTLDRYGKEPEGKKVVYYQMEVPQGRIWPGLVRAGKVPRPTITRSHNVQNSALIVKPVVRFRGDPK